MTAKPVDLILFDLGGVLFRNVSIQKINDWLPGGISISEFKNKWIRSKAVRDFESAKISENEFASALIAEFSLKTDSASLIREFRNFVAGYYEGAEDMLLKLGAKYKLATLSNTNGVHWKTLMDHFKLNTYIQTHFPSHITGLVKPDRKAFLNVTETLNLKPDQILYFDDDPGNIESAGKTGFNAFLANGVPGVKQCLREELDIEL